ncbi:hypothetical protein [Streptomyces sp. NPDC002265]|uniref:hypothetical protein n=1 Tax=Streptomyces sp. NPDC002265 TaxID=3154415 RepID=UPI0033253FA0
MSGAGAAGVAETAVAETTAGTAEETEAAEAAEAAEETEAAEAAGEADAADAAEAVADAGSPRPRRRGRTTAMIAGAAVLGTVAGTCVGYLVQADRAPTALPSLSQAVVKQAGGEVEPLSAAQDRKVKMDGDLRKLLLDRPKGTKEIPMGDEGWESLAEYAERYDKPANAFSNLAEDEFRRSAGISWRSGSTYNVEIVLTQFRQESKAAASEWSDNGHYWAEKEGHTRDWPIPGTGDGNGTVYVHDTPDRKPGYLPFYTAEAHAWRGDVYMEIWINDSKPIPKAKIMDLAERQVGKL